MSDVIDVNLEANEIIYTDLIDAIVGYCELYNWDVWSSYAHSYNNIAWPRKLMDNAFELRRKVEKAIFPNTIEELERSIKTVGILFNGLINVFSEHCETKNDIVYEDKFYRIKPYDQILYNQLLNEYYTWKNEYYKLFDEFVKALNWFATVVRNRINPLFFATEGKFTLTLVDGLSAEVTLLEYQECEIEKMPDQAYQLLSEAQLALPMQS